MFPKRRHRPIAPDELRATITANESGCTFEWTLGMRMGRGAGWLGDLIADMVADAITDGIAELRRIVESPT